MSSKLQDYLTKLERLRKPKSDDPYDNRITHCYILHELDGKDHTFEVRGWRPIVDDKLEISVVNWTLCAGTATLTVTEDTVDTFRISSVSER